MAQRVSKHPTPHTDAEEPGSRADATPERRAGRCAGSWAILLTVLILGIGADLLSKHLAFEHIWHEPVALDRDVILDAPREWHPPSDAHVVVVLKVLDLRLVVNRGAVFGIGPGQRYFFIGFTLLALAIGLVVFAMKTRCGDRVAHFAIGLILAGAIGNLYDRIKFGAVRDFLNLFPNVHLPLGWTWPGGNSEIFPWVFNVADMLLLAGIGLLMIVMNRTPSSTKSNTA